MIAAALLVTAAVVAGELLVLRLGASDPLPLSFAVMIVAVRVLDVPAAAAAIAAGEAIAVLARRRGPVLPRVAGALHHTLVGGAGVGAAYLATGVVGRPERLGGVLALLGITAAAMIAADEASRRLRRRASALGARGGRAWLGLASCGALMALGARGVAGAGRFGTWGAVLFGIPLLAAWWSFERLDAASRAQSQTLEALAMAPELAGYVAGGHAARVAALCRRVARELDLPAPVVADLEAAALLHHLGTVTIDAPGAWRGVHALDVSRTTAALLRPLPALHAAGSIVAGDAAPPRWDREGDTARATCAQILRVASAYDDLTGGDPARAGSALDAVIAAPDALVDLRVLEAFERVIASADRRPRLAALRDQPDG